jgi:hypothetical protein
VEGKRRMMWNLQADFGLVDLGNDFFLPKFYINEDIFFKNLLKINRK